MSERRIYGREAVDLAKVLDVCVFALDEHGVERSHLADDAALAVMLANGNGARIALSVGHAAEEVSERVRMLAEGILNRGQTVMSVAFLCAVQKVVRSYDGT